MRLVNAQSRVHAYNLMKNYSRTKPSNRISWTQSPDIRDNLFHTLDHADPFFTTIANNGALMTDMRYVRNHVAHFNTGTRNNFRKLIKKHYGGLKQGVTPGLLLLTQRIGTRPLLITYILATRVLIKDLVRA